MSLFDQYFSFVGRIDHCLIDLEVLLISNTRDSVSSGYPNTEKRVEYNIFQHEM